MIRKHWTVILLLALAAAGRLGDGPADLFSRGRRPVALLAQRAPAGFSDGGDSMAGGLVVVWAHRAPAGFSDGGDSVAGTTGWSQCWRNRPRTDSPTEATGRWPCWHTSPRSVSQTEGTGRATWCRCWRNLPRTASRTAGTG